MCTQEDAGGIAVCAHRRMRIQVLFFALGHFEHHSLLQSSLQWTAKSELLGKLFVRRGKNHITVPQSFFLQRSNAVLWFPRTAILDRSPLD